MRRDAGGTRPSSSDRDLVKKPLDSIEPDVIRQWVEVDRKIDRAIKRRIAAIKAEIEALWQEAALGRRVD